jgi:hypothetical protein
MSHEPDSTTSVVDPVPFAPAANARHAPATAKENPSRCQHGYENGTLCRTPGLPSQSGLCIRHFNLKVASGLPLVPTPSDFEDLSADLLPELSDFDAALSVNQFLSRLLVLVTKGRVTPRRAAVMAYITNQILHSHRAIDREQILDEDHNRHDGPTVIWDLPRPDRSEPYAGVTHPTPAEVYVPGHNSTDSGNGAPK